MNTFVDFIGQNKNEEQQKVNDFPTFMEMKEGSVTPCMSESMLEKMGKVYESMCKEMKDVHEDETPRTCETYMVEAGLKINEMMENLQKQCESYLAALH